MVGSFKKNWFVLSLLAVMLTAGGAWAATNATDSIDPQNIRIPDVTRTPAKAPRANKSILTVGPGQTYTTIQAAIDAAAPGDVINVLAGEYYESIGIGTSGLTINGPNAGIDPNTGTRVAEAVIYPTDYYGVYVVGGNVTIDGFTIDGDNPTLTSGLVINGADVDAEYGVYAANLEADGPVTVSNNIIVNQGTWGFLGYIGSAMSSGNVVKNNFFDNIEANTTYGGSGRCVVPYWSYYVSVIDNTFQRCSIGIYTGNSTLAAGTAPTFSGNTIYSKRSGIWHNLQYGAVPTFTITDNDLYIEDNPTGTRWDGIWLTSVGNASTAVDLVITNNRIHGSAVTQQTNGYHLWNNPTPTGITLSGGTVSDVDYGVWVNNWKGYADSNGGDTQAYIDGVAIDNVDIAVYVQDDPLNTNGSTVGADVLSGTVITSAAIDVKVAGDDIAFSVDPSLAPIVWAIEGGTLQDLIDAAFGGDSILVDAGTYTESLTINKSLSLTSTAGASLTTITGVSNIAVTINADNVTLDGFTITNPLADFGIYAQDNSGIVITNNIVTNVGPTDATSSSSNSGIAVVSSAAAVNGVTITGNVIHQIDGGEYTSANGIALGWSNGANDITSVLIENNSIYDIDSSTADFSIGGRGAYGILINHAETSEAGRTVAPVIRNNTIDDLEGLWSHGIGLEGDTPNALVQGNVLSNLTDHKDPADAIGVFFEANGFVSSTLVTHNSFTNIAWGIAAHPTSAIGAIDAPLNWYGSADPAVVAAQIGGLEIDHSPWLASGVDADALTPGFQGDLSNLWVGPGGSIQEAVDAVVGSTVNVAAGIYTEGTVIIDKSLNLIGPNAGVAPDGTRVPEAEITDTRIGFANGTSGVVIDGFTFTGTPSQSAINAQNISADDITVRYNRFVDMAMTAIYTSNAANSHDGWVVTNNLFSNIGYNGDWNSLTFATASALNLWHTSNLTVTDNVVQGVAYNGMNLETVAVATVQGNTFRDIGKTGIQLAGPSVGPMDISSNLFERCNQRYSLDFNFWYGAIKWYDAGAEITATGAYSITDNVMDDCVVGYQFARALPLSGGPTITFTGNTMRNNTFAGFLQYRPGGLAHDISGNWWNHVSGPALASFDYESWLAGEDPEIYVTVTGGGLGDRVVTNATDPVGVTVSPWTGGASASVTATSGPISCSGSKVLTFNYVPTATTPDIFLFDATVRATSEVSFGTITNEDLFNGTGYFYVVDNVDGSKTITAATLATGGDPYEAGNGDHAMFSIEFLGATEGTATITVEDFTLRDPTNATILVNMPSTTIDVDCTAPLAVTGVTAAPGHNKVDVSWTHAGADVDHFEVFSGLWYAGTVGTSAYPEYDDLANDVIPTAPSNYATAVASSEWDLLVGDATTTLTETWPNATQRGVYYYTVFAVDAAGNASPAPAGLDRSTNYWLGDVVINGMVNVPDMNTLGAAFGTSNGVGAYNAYVDVGPTDDFSRLGIPNTDSKINFEDLMIFSLNFGVVSAAKDKAPVSKTVDLAWVSYDNGDMALRLVNGSGLKGLNVRAGLPVGQVEAGQLLDDQSEVTFLMNVGENLDVSVAVMGVNQGFEGTGDLFIVRSGSGISMDDLHITARATDNSDLEVNLDMTSGTLTPRVFNLNANYPNPFNPMTKISFSLPEAQNVRLNVYSLDGRKVATLLNETRGAGLHEVVWTGRNDDGQSVASGLYFYRIDAGPYSQVRKMTLMK